LGANLSTRDRMCRSSLAMKSFMVFLLLLACLAGCGESGGGNELSDAVNRLDIDVIGVVPFRVEGTVLQVEEGPSGTFVKLNAVSTQIVSGDASGKTLTPGTTVIFKLRNPQTVVKAGERLIAVGQISRSGDGYNIIVDAVRKQ
jgi:hypothetical protein